MRAFSTPADSLRLALLAALGLPFWAGCGGVASQEGASSNSGGSVGVGGGASDGGSHQGDGGSPSGGATSTGGASTGGASTGGVGGTLEVWSCTDPQPLVPGHDTGYFWCAEGFEHRAEKKDCPSFLPRATELPPNGDSDQCVKDSDCPGVNAFCVAADGFGIINTCVTGCISDADCTGGAICRCGDPVGRCVHPIQNGEEAPCTVDSDCELGLCAGVRQEQGCGFSVQYACKSAADECESGRDCNVGDNCQVAYDGTHRACVASPVCGRPFLVDFLERRAEGAARRDWTLSARAPSLASVSAGERERLAAHWTDIALMEHASIAAFARFSLQLLSLGAPADLVEETNRALADETKHARLCFALASSYRGADVGPGPLDVSGSLDGATPEAILRTVIREGCVGETQAALEAAESLAVCEDSAVAEVLTVIARDEARHAELAWRFVQWLVTERPELRAVAEEELASLLAEAHETSSPPLAAAELERHGVLGEAARHAVRLQALSAVVAPCAAGLLGGRAASVARTSAGLVTSAALA